MNPDISHYYKILELEQGASQPEIKRAYRDLAMVWHPDRFSNPRMQQKAEARLKQINAAYEFLKLYQPQTVQQKVEPVEPETENRKFVQMWTWEDIGPTVVIVLMYLVMAYLVTVAVTMCFVFLGFDGMSVPLAVIFTIAAYLYYSLTKKLLS